ncbi:MAG: hypothetical protein HQM16_03585 [Deltaproteobacteria bacterium]|nr:hypothetical protein [Deltaproteobacteria bacterium]
MTTKLTLALDGSVVKRAKKYARDKNLCLSKLVEFFFLSLTSKATDKSMAISPITAGLVGMVKTGNIKDKEVLTSALIKKYQ